MSANNLNPHQLAYLLALMAFAGEKAKGTQAALQAAVERRLPEVLEQLPGWNIVWGPVVWKFLPDDASTGPDHISFVVRNPDLAYPNGEKKDTYVYSIAGTQTNYNWVVNNGIVSGVVDFHKWLKSGITTPPRWETSTSPENCYISMGTALGVYRLATAAPPPSAASPGVEIASYWANFPESPNTNVIIAGHSLGGPLSSTMALALVESRAFAKFPPSNILVYPTAGPAIGNLVFSELFSKRFPKVPGESYQVWNCMIVNILDPIAQPWCTSKEKSPKQNLHNIPDIFGKSAPPIPEVLIGVNLAQYLASASTITYIPIQAAWFEGTPPSSPPVDLDGFLELTWPQHTDELLNLMGVRRIRLDIYTGEEEGVQRMSDEEVARIEPFTCEVMSQVDSQKVDEGDLERCKSQMLLSEPLAL